MATIAKIHARDGMMDVYLGTPSRQAPGPAIILMYHRGGIDDFTKGVVDRLVGSGYLVAVPDVDRSFPVRKTDIGSPTTGMHTIPAVPDDRQMSPFLARRRHSGTIYCKFTAGPKCNYSPCAHAQYCLGKVPYSYATAQFADRRCRLEHWVRSEV